MATNFNFIFTDIMENENTASVYSQNYKNGAVVVLSKVDLNAYYNDASSESTTTAASIALNEVWVATIVGNPSEEAEEVIFDTKLVMPFYFNSYIVKNSNIEKEDLFKLFYKTLTDRGHYVKIIT